MDKLILITCLILLTATLAGCTGGEEEPAGAWTVTVRHADGSEDSYDVKSWDLGADRDEDGLDDLQEMLQQTDPRKADTDEDGLLDGNNVTLSVGKAPMQEWIDLGLVHFEDAEGNRVFQGEYPHGSTVLNAESDGDGIADGEEVQGYSVDVLGEERFVQTSPRMSDTSGDGISDGVSRSAGLDPSTRDTDGDSVDDGQDLDPFRDLEAAFDISTIDLAGSSGSRSLYFHVQVPGETYQSDVVEVPRGEEQSGESFRSPTLDIEDRGAHFMGGKFNFTFSVTALAEEGGETVRVDLFSQSTGHPTLIGELDVRTGELRVVDGTARTPWPDRFEGGDGSVDLGLELPFEPWGIVQGWGPQPESTPTT